MIQIFKNLFGAGSSPDLAGLYKNGARIIDVRTRAEYKGGHIKGSLNIPLDELRNASQSLPKDKPLITCCASGMRSASAKSMLKAAGFSEVYNGGGWAALQQKLGR